jgi:hypothetical protein
MKGNRGVVASLVAVGFLLASCDSPTHHQVVGDATLLRQAHLGDMYPAGMGIGQLVVRRGCVGLGGPSGVAYVVWVPGSELRDGPEGLEVIGADGNGAKIREMIEIGGGYFDLVGIDGLTADGIPDHCRVSGSQSYFLQAPGPIAHATP